MQLILTSVCARCLQRSFSLQPARLILQDVNCNVLSINKTLIIALTGYLVTQFCTLRKNNQPKTTPEKQQQQQKKGKHPGAVGDSTPEIPGGHNNTLTVNAAPRTGRTPLLCTLAADFRARGLLLSWQVVVFWGFFFRQMQLGRSERLTRTHNKPTQRRHLISQTGSHVSAGPLPTATGLALLFCCSFS